MNETNASLPSPIPKQDDGGGKLDIQVGLTLFGICCFLVSLIGNTTVIHVIRMRKHMRNVTNILIANMSAADLLITVLVFPYLCKYYYVGPQWFGGIAGSVTCTIFHSSQMISIFCSVYTLLVISVDRCFAVMRPMKKYFTAYVTKCCIAAVWLVSVLFSIPLMIATKVITTPDSKYLCIEDWRETGLSARVHVIIFVLLTYIIPLGLIGSAYAVTGHKLWGSTSAKHENPLNRSNQDSVRATRRKATKMLITVVVLFALCWLPLQVRELIHVSSPEVSKAIPAKLDYVLPWFGFFSSCTNPFVYIIFSERFRMEFKRVLCFWMTPEQFEVFSTPGSPVTRTRLATIKKYSQLANGSPCPKKRSDTTSV